MFSPVLPGCLQANIPERGGAKTLLLCLSVCLSSTPPPPLSSKQQNVSISETDRVL